EASSPEGDLGRGCPPSASPSDEVDARVSGVLPLRVEGAADDEHDHGHEDRPHEGVSGECECRDGHRISSWSSSPFWRLRDPWGTRSASSAAAISAASSSDSSKSPVRFRMSEKSKSSFCRKDIAMHTSVLTA